MIRAALTIAMKDITTELRTGARVVSMGAFVVLSALLFGFGLDRTMIEPRTILSGLIWLTLIFASMMGLGRTFEMEEEDGAFRYLMMAPVSREALFLGKALANLCLVWLTALMTSVGFSIFLGVTWSGAPLHHLAVFFSGTVALVALTTLFSRISSHSRLGSTLLPVLTFPILVPMVLFAATSTHRLLMGRPWDEIDGMVRLLGAMAIGATFFGAVLFRFVAEE